MNNERKAFYTISEAANFLTLSPSTLRNYDEQGIFVPARRMDGGRRLYSYEQIIEFLEKCNKEEE